MHYLPTDGAGQLPIYTAALKTPGTERVVARQQARLTVRLEQGEEGKNVLPIRQLLLPDGRGSREEG